MYKKGFVPKHTKLKNLQGHLVNDRQRPDTFAEYYAKGAMDKCENLSNHRGNQNYASIPHNSQH
eukprot:4974969-Heterocapsa_arctica.AAC.1